MQLMKSRCVHLSQELVNLLPTTISTPVLLKLLFILIFHSCSMSSFLKSALTYCYMQQGWFPTVVALSMCQFHRHCFVSGIFILLSCYLNSCNCFDDHVMLSCYLHLSLRL